jgi:ferredoxin
MAGKIDIDRSKCCYCGGCVGVCPADALELRDTILCVDEEKCTKCGTCVKFCPVDAISLIQGAGATI